MAVKIDLNKCDGCGKCIEVCPVEGIKLEKGKAGVTEQCVDCETCISVCPNQAIRSGTGQ